MSQNDFNIANQGFPAFRSDLNDAFAAIVSQSSGATAPSTTSAYMFWYDTANDILKMRNADDDAWIDVLTFDQSTNGAEFVIGGGSIDDTPIGATTPSTGAFTSITATLKAASVAGIGLSTASIYATYGGTANAITLTSGLGLASLTTGQEVRFRATSSNTGAATINVDGIGAVTAKTATGEALPSGYIRTDVDTVGRYDGTDIILFRSVETGSNANGRWAKLEDGTLTCWNERFELDYAGAAFCEAVWTTPATFASTTMAPRATYTPPTSGGDISDSASLTNALEAGAISADVLTTSTINFAAFAVRGYANYSSGDHMYLNVKCDGRWF